MCLLEKMIGKPVKLAHDTDFLLNKHASENGKIKHEFQVLMNQFNQTSTLSTTANLLNMMPSNELQQAQVKTDDIAKNSNEKIEIQYSYH